MKIFKLKLSGFKNVSDDTEITYDFYKHTLIEGDNFTGKTSICEAIVWGFCGCNIDGHLTYYKLLRNKDSEKMFVEIYFSDNNEQKHVLRRSMDRDGTIIILDNKKITQKEMENLIKSKDIFMSVFVPGYFSKFSTTEARNFILNIVPNFDMNEVWDKLPDDERYLIKENDLVNLIKIISKKRKKIRELEKLEISLKGELKGIEGSIVNIDINRDFIDNKDLMEEIEKLELKLNLLLVHSENTKLDVLIKERNLLRKEYEFYKSKIDNSSYKIGEKCSICLREFDKETINNININAKNNKEIHEKLNEIVIKGKELKEEIDGYNLNSSKVDNQEEINFLKDKLKNLKEKLNDINMKNTKYETNKKIYKNSLFLKEKIESDLKNTVLEKNKIMKTLNAYIHANAVRADVLFQNLENNLNRVSINLEKVNKNTGEIKEFFEIKYDNKEFRLLSNSERIRAYLEISSLVNHYTNLKLPIFIDNAESITNYDKPEVQIFESRVEKYFSTINIKSI
ncbi:MAG: AAA family ATPase [Clostridiales bacterium]